MGTLGDFKQGSERSISLLPVASAAAWRRRVSTASGGSLLPVCSTPAQMRTECLVAAEGELGEASGHEAQDEDRVSRFG